MSYIGNGFSIPLAVMSDSYKASHFLQYPKCKKMVAYGEFRRPYQKDPKDHRIVYWGMRYIVKHYLEKQWTVEEVERADKFYKTHAVMAAYPYPKHLFLKFIKENNGYFPIRVESLPDGTAVYARTPVYQLTTEDEYAPLCTFLETIITQIWYASTVATTSRRIRDIIEKAFIKSVDEEFMWLLDSRLHDFGFRGVSSCESAILGGTAHLLNFRGTDTMPAAYYAQFELNKGVAVAESIPATEHSVMTSWRNEDEAINNMLVTFKDSVLIATVMDSYSYSNALWNIMPKMANLKKKTNNTWVLRPDSGEPIAAVLEGLAAAEATFGFTRNKKGYKVLNHCAVIQGDGITAPLLEKIVNAAVAAGFSAQNVAFGLGAGLLQRVNRDTASFATKLCHIEYADGSKRDIMKTPVTDSTKFSLPGILAVKSDSKGVPITCCASEVTPETNLFSVVYDKGPVKGVFSETFDEMRKRLNKEWTSLPKLRPPFSEKLQKLVEVSIAENTRKVASFGSPGPHVVYNAKTSTKTTSS